ncbi:MAG: hypothetical protein JW800_05950, partial [Candidatus Omnitrophica bacterium]|nr:hypothetical protein [Candidatus Omnitrophota bacterium]
MEKVKAKDSVTSISIHSSRVAACVVALDEDNKPFVLGVGKADGKLLGGKGILNIDALSKAMMEALSIAQSESGCRSHKVVASIAGGSVESELSRGIVKLSSKGEEIKPKHVKSALKIADAIPVDRVKDIVHSIPQNFIVDGQPDIQNPIGLHGVKVEIETLLITAHTPF